ncbi:MAG: DUF2887 domain-containing protein [Calothrix sp. SM1_7_51]|nr:DUF2887 domain-containing protein [Calothrix sp. SM1_7_51]
MTQYEPPNKQWYAIVIYDRRSREGTFPPYLNVFLPVLRRFYLDELANTPDQSLSVGIMRLIVQEKNKKKTGELARQLIKQTNSQITNAVFKEKVLEFIQTIVIDKFVNLSREELEAMLELESIRKSKVYQEAKEEGIQEGVLEHKLKMIPILSELGLTIEQTAERLELDVETVRQHSKQ